MRRAGLLASTAASAVAYGCAFPLANLQPPTWIALVPFFVALRRAELRTVLVLGWVWAIVAAYTVGDWFPTGIAHYFAQAAAGREVRR